MRCWLVISIACWVSTVFVPSARSAERPNVILLMSDDHGWGETGYAGHKHLKTPCLDEMAKSGVRFNRFYAAMWVCSPTRASVLTGRHPNRMGVYTIGVPLRAEEVTLAEALRSVGYRTAHFGKWHLGQVNEKRGPQEHGFDECFSTGNNSKRVDPDQYYHNGKAVGVIKGEDNQILMDRVLDFVGRQAKQENPFLAVVWFHTPHVPRGTTQEFLDLYPANLANRTRLGDISAMDRQVGRLRQDLRKMGIADKSLLWFCSDNGADSRGEAVGGLRGSKGTPWEGGLRVPGLLEWPARIKKPFQTELPCSTMDIYPTILDLLGLKAQNQPEPIDGISLQPLLDGQMLRRPTPIPFWGSPQKVTADGKLLGRAGLIEQQFKLHRSVTKDGEDSYALYDLLKDPRESHDLSKEKLEIVVQMKTALHAWQRSVQQSASGKDYPPAKR